MSGGVSQRSLCPCSRAALANGQDQALSHRNCHDRRTELGHDQFLHQARRGAIRIWICSLCCQRLRKMGRDVL